jgi:hypothetical protein
MLVLEAFKGLTPEVECGIHATNIDPVVIPRGMSPQVKILDIVLNKPFKEHLKQ